MTTLLIATRNAHKVAEIEAILGPQFRCLSLKAFPDAPAVIEDADTFAGNAAKKAVELSAWLSTNFEVEASRTAGCAPSTAYERAAGRLPALPCILADDSGLEVDALNGAPGVHSARFAASDPPGSGNSADADNNAKLLRLLKDVPLEKRTARFRCVIAFVAGNAGPQLFDGACEGHIEFAPRGQNGFGYDPLFVPEGFQQTFAELGEDTKNQLSHRATALAKLKTWLVVGS